jgi:hypothetical protein
MGLEILDIWSFYVFLYHLFGNCQATVLPVPVLDRPTKKLLPWTLSQTGGLD